MAKAVAQATPALDAAATALIGAITQSAASMPEATRFATNLDAVRRDVVMAAGLIAAELRTTAARTRSGKSKVAFLTPHEPLPEPPKLERETVYTLSHLSWRENGEVRTASPYSQIDLPKALLPVALAASLCRSDRQRAREEGHGRLRQRPAEHAAAIPERDREVPSRHGRKPLKGLTRVHIKAIIEAKAAKPEAANHLLKVLRVLLNFALDHGMIVANPAVGIKKYRSRNTEGFHLWTEEEIAQFEKHYPVGTKARTALALMLYTAQRRGDMIRMGWQHVRGDEISVTQQKTGATLVIPMRPELVRVLEGQPRKNLTFLMTEHGAPFTNAGFGNWWRDRCNEAGFLQCTAHGLRKAATVRLVEAGCTDEQIMAVTGIRSPSVLKIYKRGADQRRLARQALTTQLRAEGEQSLSNLSPRLDKTGEN